MGKSKTASKCGRDSASVVRPDAMRQKLVHWLKREGYPLEMRTAESLRKAGFQVQQSPRFLDPETGKVREIDVIATAVDKQFDAVAQVQFVVECKSIQKPWVLFSSPHTLDWYNLLFAFAISDPATKKAFHDTGSLHDKLPWFSKSGNVGYSLRVAFADGEDRAYAAVTSAVKACLFQMSPDPEGFFVPPIRFLFPAVVVGAPLFECAAAEDGEMAITEIEQGWLFYDTKLPQVGGTCVRIVSHSALGQFTSEAQETQRTLFAVLAEAIARERRALHSRWSENSQP